MGEIKTVDVQVHDGDPRGRYQARGVYDVLWTDDLDEALAFLKSAVEQVTSSV